MPRTFKPFLGLAELVDYLKDHEGIYYLAPLDHEPRWVAVREYTISNVCLDKSHAKLYTPATKTFRVNLLQHLDRFRTCEVSNA